MRILLIEDDADLCETLCHQLTLAGFAVDFCHSGEDGLLYIKNNFYDVCVLDRLLPELDGMSLLKAARKSGITTPVLMLTALGRIDDRVDGLEAGADDYLAKPFDMRELTARIRALVRRPSAHQATDELCCKNIVLNKTEQRLSGAHGTADLSKTECELLEVLIKHFGNLQSRATLLGRVWGANADVEDASLDSYIHFVRRRLNAVGANVKITTVRGSGYKLEEV